MSRSWARPRFLGYEIKVARSDFLNDHKWVEYLDYCTEFYFVAPPNVIQKDEVPENAGLLLTTKNCKRLLTIKKAPVRQIDIPKSLLIYILMCRTRIVRDTIETAPAVVEWERRLENMRRGKKVGSRIGAEIKKRVSRQVQEIIDENGKLRDANKRFGYIRSFLDKHNLDLSSLTTVYGARNAVLEEALSGMPVGLQQQLHETERSVKRLREMLVRANPLSGK
jgi:hypothetical protein